MSSGSSYGKEAQFTGVRPLLFGATLAGFNPGDATAYLFGGRIGQVPHTVGAGRVPFTRKARIIGIDLSIDCTTAGTTEKSVLNFVTFNRLTGIKQYRIFQNLDFSALSRQFSIDSLDIPVDIDQFGVFQWTSPTWVTNPLGVTFYGNLILKYP